MRVALWIAAGALGAAVLGAAFVGYAGAGPVLLTGAFKLC